MDIVTCGGCLWWAKGARDDEGKCHRHAPRAVVVWPTTKSVDFCGEAEPKPDTTPIEIH